MKNPVKDIITQYVSNDYPEEIDRRFRSWLTDPRHADEKDCRLKELWDETQADTIDGMAGSMARMQQLTGMADRRRLKLANRRLQRWRLSAAAAIIIAVAATAGLAISHRTPIEESPDLLQAYIPKAAMQSITLPDGTVATLNANTILLYPESFSGPTRSVYLTGEAIFEVTPDSEHPFIVKTNDLQVTALGTEFNIAAYPEDSTITTTLIKGKVKVDFDNLTRSQILNPADRLAYNPSTRKASFSSGSDIDDATAWRRGEIVMRGLTATEIFNRLSRRYNRTFIYDPTSFSSDRYTLTFAPDASIAEVMDIVAKVMGYISYTIDSDSCCIEVH